MTRGHLPGALAALLAAVLLLGLTAHLPAEARPVRQTTEGDPDPAPAGPAGAPRELELVAQTDWVPEGGAFNLRVAVPDAVSPDAALVLDLHRSVTSRSQFAATLAGDLLGRRLAEVVIPLRELVPLADGSRRVHLTPSPTGAPGERPLPALSSGVHPLVVSIRPPDPGGEAPGSFTTYLVRTPATVVQPLRVAVVQPFGAGVARQPDGTVAFDPSLTTLAGLAAVLARSDVPLSVTPRPETLQALQEEADDGDAAAAAVLAGLRAALPGRQVVATPYVAIEPDTLEAAGLGADVALQRRRGDEVVEATLGATSDVRIWVEGTATSTPALRRLADLGVRQLVLPDTALDPVDLRLTLSRPFAVPVGDGLATLAGAAADPALSARYGLPSGPLAAQHALADLAVLHGDEPASATPRGVVVAPPPGGSTDPLFLAELLDGLATAPILRSVTLEQWFAEVAPQDGADGVLVRRTVPAGDELGIGAPEVAEARAQVSGFAAMVDGGAGAEAATRFRDLTLRAEASELSPQRRRAYLEAATSAVNQQVRTIRVVDRAAFRLPDSEGTIPLTLVQDTPYPMRVRVTLESDKLEFGEGETRTVGTATFDLTLTEENTPLVVPVSVRSPGTFPLLVSITSPDGGLEVLATRITVRSTAFSGVGIALSVSAGAFLLVWWARHWRTVRRARRLVPVA